MRPQTAQAVAPAGRPLPVAYSAVLALVLAGAALYGLLVEGAYRVSPGVRENLPGTMQGQDLLTLLTLPVLLGCAVLARRGSLRAHLAWLGLQLYYAYSYLTYAVIPFNDVFLLYCAVIGLSGFALLNGLLRLDVQVVDRVFDRAPRRALAAFLVAVGALFAMAWLAMILPATFGSGLPEGRVTYDIPSAIHVLDLSIVLPLIVATGVLLWRRHVAAPALAAVLLVKMVTLGLALLLMNAFVDEPSITEVASWTAVILVAAGWLVVCGRRAAPDTRGWLRPHLWP